MKTHFGESPIEGGSPSSTKIKPRADHTITRADLANAVYNVIGTTRTEASFLVDEVLDRIFETICRGETVKLHNFGKFVIRHKDKRAGRNPRTLEPAEITERRVVQFKASPAMKQKLNRHTRKPARAKARALAEAPAA